MHLRFGFCAFLLLLLFDSPVLAAPSCKDQSGSPVDWFVIVKPPWISTSLAASYQKGAGYSYADSNQPALVPTNSTLFGAGALTSTMQQAYTAAPPADLGWAFYNDNPAKDANGVAPVYDFTVGHTKGAAIFDSGGGLFLLHSVPHFPPSVTAAGYSYPSSGTANGQTFLCTTLDPKNLNAVFSQWLYSYPRIYSKRFNAALAAVYPSLAPLLATPQPKVAVAPFIREQAVSTRGGKTLRYLAKSNLWGKQDLWEHGVAPMLGVDLRVQTWQLNGNNMGAYCKSNATAGHKYNVVDIGGLAFKSSPRATSPDVSWLNTKDHSKWAVSEACTSNASALWVCFGDINRQTGQYSRAGGAMCLQSAPLHQTMYALVQPLLNSCDGAPLGLKCSVPMAAEMADVQTAAKVDARACYDGHLKCSHWAASCDSLTIGKWVQLKCPASCGLCSKRPATGAQLLVAQI